MRVLHILSQVLLAQMPSSSTSSSSSSATACGCRRTGRGGRTSSRRGTSSSSAPSMLLVYCYVYCFVFFSFHRALSSVVALSASFICNKIPGLAPEQRTICQTHPGAMVAVGEGVNVGLSECQYQFRERRWNCTGGRDLLNPRSEATKEAAYLHAIRSAGVAYAITQACSQGNLTSCGCDKSKMAGLKDPSGFKWGGCSADVKYGLTFARTFMDATKVDGCRECELMMIHNHRAGRKAVRDQMAPECKCHGVSGACTLQTCWMQLPSFRAIGDRLSGKYDRAKKVAPILGHRERAVIFLELERSKSLHKKPRRGDLVYINRSPNYCEASPVTGSLGTQGRRCNLSSDAIDSCESLCCGRGYNTHQYTQISQCNCKFHWCCKVTCDQCSERTEEYTCK